MRASSPIRLAAAYAVLWALLDLVVLLPGNPTFSSGWGLVGSLVIQAPGSRAAGDLRAECENSPLCDRCGHPRADHTRVFTGRAEAGCSRVVGDFQSLRSWRCDCNGFRPVTGPLADASFAAAEPVGTQPPRLRDAETV